MHNIHPYFQGVMERSQASSDFVSPSLITLLSCHSKDRELMVLQCTEANILASARNTNTGLVSGLTISSVGS